MSRLLVVLLFSLFTISAAADDEMYFYVETDPPGLVAPPESDPLDSSTPPSATPPSSARA